MNALSTTIYVKFCFLHISFFLFNTDNLIANFTSSMVHRPLVRQCPIRIFIFDNRVKIHSLGTLPDYGLNVKDIKVETSFSHNIFCSVMPYFHYRMQV